MKRIKETKVTNEPRPKTGALDMDEYCRASSTDSGLCGNCLLEAYGGIWSWPLMTTWTAGRPFWSMVAVKSKEVGASHKVDMLLEETWQRRQAPYDIPRSFK